MTEIDLQAIRAQLVPAIERDHRRTAARTRVRLHATGVLAAAAIALTGITSLPVHHDRAADDRAASMNIDLTTWSGGSWLCLTSTTISC